MLRRSLLLTFGFQNLWYAWSTTLLPLPLTVTAPMVVSPFEAQAGLRCSANIDPLRRVCIRRIRLLPAPTSYHLLPHPISPNSTPRYLIIIPPVSLEIQPLYHNNRIPTPNTQPQPAQPTPTLYLNIESSDVGSSIDDDE